MFLQCLGGLLHGGCSGSFCGAVLVVGLGVCGVAGVAGGVVGAVTATSLKNIEAKEKNLSETVDAKLIQESLRDQVVEAALSNGTSLVLVPSEIQQNAVHQQDYHSFTQAGADHVIEISLTETGVTRYSGDEPSFSPYMKAHIRVVDTSNNEAVYSADYIYEGPNYNLSEWSYNSYTRLLRAINAGYTTLGTQIYDNIFLLYPFPDRHSHGNIIGLKAIYPSSAFPNRPIVKNVYPQLRWEAFPRSSDMEIAPEEMRQVKNVRYDLIIAEEHSSLPDEIIYQRHGLRSNTHTLEIPLEHKKSYFWTVRARFELDGQEHVTEWSSSNIHSPDQSTVPSKWSYQFTFP